jgi:hypothetical protein
MGATVSVRAAGHNNCIYLVCYHDLNFLERISLYPHDFILRIKRLKAASSDLLHSIIQFGCSFLLLEGQYLIVFWPALALNRLDLLCCPLFFLCALMLLYYVIAPAHVLQYMEIVRHHGTVLGRYTGQSMRDPHHDTRSAIYT